MPEERRDAKPGAQKNPPSTEKTQPKMSTPATRVVCGQHNSTPRNGGNLEPTNEENINRLCADLKDQVAVSAKLPNGSVSINCNNSSAGMETTTTQKSSATSSSSTSSVSSTCTPVKPTTTTTSSTASNPNVVPPQSSSSLLPNASDSNEPLLSNASQKPTNVPNSEPAAAASVDASVVAGAESETDDSPIAKSSLTSEIVEPNNNHLPVAATTNSEHESPVAEREGYRPAPVKEVSPVKSSYAADSRSKTSTPQEQRPPQWDAHIACYKSTRRACRSKSINGSPASYHTSLMGPAQPSMYTQTYPPTAHYYALYASSQSVPIACRHETSLQQFAYRHHNTGAMNGDGREERLSTTNLFVRPLLETDTKETLIALVASAVIGGDKAVKSARVTHDRKQRDMMNNRYFSTLTDSYGFIDFYQEENARKALEFLSKDLTIRQCRPGLEVKYARDSEKDDKNVYLSGVPTDFTDKDQLLQIFQPYGAIDSVHIMTNSSGDPTGVAFVRFNTTEEAERAIEAVKNGDVLINGKSVDAKFADRHSAEDKRRRRRQNLSTTTIYQNGAAAGLATPTGLVNGYGSMSSAHALASASPQPHLNMVIPSYAIRYYPTASGPAPFLSSSAPSSAAALGGTHSHFVSLHPGATAAYQLSNASATGQYPAAAAAMLGANPNPSNAATQAAALTAAALNAAAASYHHPLSAAGSTAPSHQSFVSPHDQATLSAYQYYLNGAGGYPVTENGAAGAAGGVPVTSATAAYFQPAAAQ